MNNHTSSAYRPTLVVIAGPTAVGKTLCAIEVAEYLNTEIISADSRQIYKEMNIGVARPTDEELARVPHHFISEKSIHETFTAADFENEAIVRINKIFESNDHAVLSGGTGLYLKAVLDGLDDIPASDKAVEAAWQQKLKAEGIEALQEALREQDPQYYEEVDLKNPRRLIRALSVIEVSGKAFSSFKKGKAKERPFQTVVIKLDRPRTELYNRINRRVDLMMSSGLLEEAKSLQPYFDLRPLKTVGYQEFQPYFEGSWTLAEAVDKIKQHSRNYAKRQLTWLNNSLHGIVLHPDDVLDHISKQIK
jgi:tRNA dimethylallyltransferase